jgi:hypothetical protein
VGQDVGEAERQVLPRHVPARERRGPRRERHGSLVAPPTIHCVSTGPSPIRTLSA